MVTHKDKEHIHNHLVVNSVSLETGLKYNASNKSLWDIKRESNKICERENLKVLDLKYKAKERLTSGELRKEIRGEETWKGELKECIRFTKEKTSNIDEFTRYLKSEFNIDTRITNKTISYKHPNKDKPIRGKKLGADYDKEELINEFIRKEKSINSREGTFSKGEIEGIKRKEQTRVREQSFERNFDRIYGSIGAVERRAKQFSIKTREEEQRAREKSNEILSKEIEKSLLGIREEVKKETMNLRYKTEEILKDMEQDIKKSTEKLENKSDEVAKKIEKKSNETLENMNSFWKFNKLEKGLFWTFIIAFLIYFLNQTLNVFDLKISSLILKIAYIIPFIFFAIFELRSDKK